MGWWQRLLSVRTPDDAALSLDGFEAGVRQGWAVGAVVALVVGCGLVVAFFYWLEPRRLGLLRRLLPALLRTAAVGVLGVMLFQPFGCTAVFRGERPRPVALLLDDSQSMGQRDRRLSVPDKLRAAVALNLLPLDTPVSGADAPKVPPSSTPAAPSRLELLHGVLDHPGLRLEERLGERGPLRAYYFGSGMRRAAAGVSLAAGLSGGEPQTALADAVREVLLKGEGDPPAAIVVCTDGVDNASRRGLADAARECAALGVPLFFYGVGSTEGGLLQFREVNAPDLLFADDLVAVPVRWRAVGVKEGQVEIVLTLNGKEVARREVAAVNGEDLREVLTFTPPKGAGDERQELVASIRVKGAEGYADEARRSVRLIDRKVKVLYVEGMPRWEYKQLMAMLLRDRRVEARFFLEGADPEAIASGPPYVPAFPATRKDLFAFDLLIVGDVSPKTLTPERLGMIRDFVAEGGGLVHIAGRVHAPAEYVGTPFAELLPVEYQPQRFARLSEVRSLGFRPQPTPLGELNEMLSLAETRDENRRIWGELPAMHWHYPVTRLKPAATPLLVHPTEKMGDEPMPLLVHHFLGKGQVLFLGVEETWRWRFNQGERYHERFWGQVVYQIGLPRNLGAKQVQIGLDRPEPQVGRPGSVYVRLLDAQFQPLRDRKVMARLEQLDGPPGPGRFQNVELLAVPGREGEYQADLANDRAGRFVLRLTTPEPSALEFRVSYPPKHELAQSGLAEGPLAEAARISGGGLYREEDLHGLAGDVKAQKAPYFYRAPVTPWNPLALVVFVLLLTTEWLIRKFSNLS
jgi:hypothetical protein